jgi:hypothetical protein
MKAKRKINRPAACTQCASPDLVRRIKTYLAPVTGPLAGKIEITKVVLHECRACGFEKPTAIGQKKVDHLVAVAHRMFLGREP